MADTYRTRLNTRVDDLNIYQTNKGEGFIRLSKGFYKTKDLHYSLRFEGIPQEEYFRSNMESFAELVGESRQNVRHAIINSGKFIFLRRGYYKKDGLICFLETFGK